MRASFEPIGMVAAVLIAALTISCSRQSQERAPSSDNLTKSPADRGPTKATGQISPPVTVQEFLRSHEEYRLITLADTEWKEEFTRGEIRPLATGDINRDGRIDLVAVLAAGTKFNVVAFLGESGVYLSQPTWILRDQEQVISGITVSDDGTVTPIYCYYCDANPDYRWDGREYSRDVHLEKEVVCVAPGSALYSTPETSTESSFRAAEDGDDAVVLQGPVWRDDEVWYRIRILNGDEVTGFIQGALLARPDGLCKG
jgi:hypothetical protein